jgi:hypothetical protein
MWMPMRNSMRRSAGKPALRFDHGILHLDGASHGIDNAAELDQRAIARALHHAPLVHGDGGIDQVGPQGAQSRERAVFVCAGEPAEPNRVSRKDRCKLSNSGNLVVSPRSAYHVAESK